MQSHARKTNRLVLAVLLAAGVTVAATASADTATSSADATIIQAISVTNSTGLDFGSVVADASTAGTVVMDTAGSRTCTTVTCPAQAAGNAASFSVTGDSNQTYSITLPSSATITESGSSSTMTVDTFTDSKGGSGTLSSGSDSFTVGATLNVDAAQTKGAYTGSFDVTVNYN